MPYGSIAPFDILARSSPLCQASMAAESCLGLHITPRVMNQNHPRARIDYLEVLPRPGTVTTAATNKSMWGGSVLATEEKWSSEISFRGRVFGIVHLSLFL